MCPLHQSSQIRWKCNVKSFIQNTACLQSLTDIESQSYWERSIFCWIFHTTLKAELNKGTGSNNSVTLGAMGIKEGQEPQDPNRASRVKVSFQKNLVQEGSLQSAGTLWNCTENKNAWIFLCNWLIIEETTIEQTSTHNVSGKFIPTPYFLQIAYFPPFLLDY